MFGIGKDKSVELWRRVAELEADLSAVRRDVGDLEERIAKYRRADVRESKVGPPGQPAQGALPGIFDRVAERRARRLALRGLNGTVE